MESHGGKIEGPFAVDRDLTIHGMVAGQATVRSGCRLVLRGTVTSDLVIEPGAYAAVHGMVNGTVINQGGHVEIHGMVGAVVDTAPSSRTVIAHGAVITRRT
ncbi:hypothetical protein B7G54_24290 [Burkholderia puraquae]|uniref:Cell shape determination protein CcmA n=1 Tax=Burkholderia puraquae TaxID=1904757 RepID=A0A1X1PCT7_9BURK|nr:hypothetical protein [Burkholderia puraquae]ORT83476.1 hypothetical protein B7G54_24290 [Burkholderia puraquae]CAB3762822.1 hypothetical protein LMG29660_04581 [Burkholderia puraquae]